MTKRKTSSQPTKRRPGAPLGNQNARKHGFYSRVLTSDALPLLKQARTIKGVKHETALMRVKLHELAGIEDIDTSLLVEVIGTLTRLTSLDSRLTNLKNRRRKTDLFPSKISSIGTNPEKTNPQKSSKPQAENNSP